LNHSSIAPLARRALLGLVATACAAAALPALAQETPIKFQLDWRFEGPAALFLVPVAKGYFKAEKLNVTVDAGNGSGGAVTRVASGSYDMGFADLAALMEFHANNPTAPNKPVAVMMVYNNTPAAVLALKKSGIRTPADLNGKKLGAPVFDAGRKAWPIFAKANSIGSVAWTAMDPPLRETMLVRGDVDAITGFSFTSLLNIEARGVKAEDVVVLPYPSYGVKLYGNAVIVSEEFLKKNPEAVKAFLRAFTKGVHDVIADPKGSIATVKARAPPEARARRHRAHGRREGRRLRQRARAAPEPDGEPGVGRVRHEGPGQGRCRVERRLPAERGGAGHLQGGEEVTSPFTLRYRRVRHQGFDTSARTGSA
jgi:NitT/TauT family transport system substrate-binding protein